MQQDLWDHACKTIEIPSEIANKWFDKITTKLTEPIRHYHNGNMLEFKVKLWQSMGLGHYLDRVHLIFGIYFQYYEYSVKNDCSEQNINAFREFYAESTVDKVCRMNLFV